MRFNVLVLLIFTVFLSCNSDDNNPPIVENEDYILVDAFVNIEFTQPVDIQNPRDGTDRLFVVEKTGIIKVFENDEFFQSSIFLSIVGNVNNQGEQGLLGLAFHPDYESNGYFYVYYNPNPSLTRISRFKVSATDPNIADSTSELILLEFFQDALNHNGGQLAFGPDGYLYISSGDGGNLNNAQNLSTLTGNILKIDVDTNNNGMNYGIPADNPYVNDMNIRDEIYAYGLRNPWRMSFDSTTGMLWTGDVGAGQREEINTIEKGFNYGWPRYEGTLCRVQPCDSEGLTPPVFEYERSGAGGAAITGGYVYRGSNNSGLIGHYIYGDFVSGEIWALDTNTLTNELLFNLGEFSVSCFGVDMNNELYVMDYAEGVIYRIDKQ